ncbi:MAG: YndJ family transporter, partial [Saprospiraceae bacterium]|nr:YndJ family transporter [Saprospiraceae bacterium]
VSLTAAHFHLAGFVVSSIVYALLMDGGGGAKSGLLAWFSLIGMPLVALGITLTRLGYVPFWEQFSALFFLFYSILLLSQLVSFVRTQGRAKGVRILVLGATFSLSLGIFLAMLYAIRFQLPVTWVTIPNMKYWHGSLNAIGFGWLALSAFSGLTER